MSDQIPLFPGTRADPARIGRSGIAHRVAWVPWLGAAGEITPADRPVTCRECLRLGGEPDDPAQHPLFALPEPH